MKIDIETLKRLVDYDPETGSLTWKIRGAWVVESGLQTEAGRKRFNNRFAGKPCFVSVDKDGYFFGSLFGKFYRAHSVAFAINNGAWAEQTVDHINNKRTDNRAKNLRDVSRFVQQQNRSTQKNNTSGVAGVNFNRAIGKWVARHQENGKRYFIGAFDEKKDAIAAKRGFFVD